MPTDYYETLGQEDIDVGTGIVSKRNPAGGSLSTTQVNLATFAINQATAESTWTPSVNSVPAGSEIDTTVTVQGAVTDDMVMASFTGMGTSILQLTAHVSDVDEVTVVLSNSSGTAQTVTSGTLRVLVFKTR